MANATGAEKFAAELVEGNRRETRAHEDERIHLRIARCAAEPIAFYRCQWEPGTRGLSSYGIEIGFSRYGRLWRAGRPLAGNNRATLGPGQPGRRLHDVHEIFGDLRPSARHDPARGRCRNSRRIRRRKFLSIDISRSLGHARSKHDARVTGAAADNMQSARSSHPGFIGHRLTTVLCAGDGIVLRALMLANVLGSTSASRLPSIAPIK